MALLMVNDCDTATSIVPPGAIFTVGVPVIAPLPVVEMLPKVTLLAFAKLAETLLPEIVRVPRTGLFAGLPKSKVAEAGIVMLVLGRLTAAVGSAPLTHLLVR